MHAAEEKLKQKLKIEENPPRKSKKFTKEKLSKKEEISSQKLTKKIQKQAKKPYKFIKFFNID